MRGRGSGSGRPQSGRPLSGWVGRWDRGQAGVHHVFPYIHKTPSLSAPVKRAAQAGRGGGGGRGGTAQGGLGRPHSVPGSDPRSTWAARAPCGPHWHSLGSALLEAATSGTVRAASHVHVSARGSGCGRAAASPAPLHLTPSCMHACTRTGGHARSVHRAGGRR